jgi:hypothetical protein
MMIEVDGGSFTKFIEDFEGFKCTKLSADNNIIADPPYRAYVYLDKAQKVEVGKIQDYKYYINSVCKAQFEQATRCKHCFAFIDKGFAQNGGVCCPSCLGKIIANSECSLTVEEILDRLNG